MFLGSASEGASASPNGARLNRAGRFAWRRSALRVRLDLQDDTREFARAIALAKYQLTILTVRIIVLRMRPPGPVSVWHDEGQETEGEMTDATGALHFLPR